MPPRAILSRDPTAAECEEFVHAHEDFVRTGQGELRNPITGRRLDNPNGDRARALLEVCRGILNRNNPPAPIRARTPSPVAQAAAPPPRRQRTGRNNTTVITREQCLEFLRNPTVNPITLETMTTRRAIQAFVSRCVASFPDLEAQLRRVIQYVTSSTNPVMVLMNPVMCDRVRANPDFHPVTNERFNANEINRWVTSCMLLHPIQHIQFNRLTLSNRQVAQIAQDFGHERNISSDIGVEFSVNDRALYRQMGNNFYAHISHFYPRTWISYYWSRQTRPYREPFDPIFLTGQPPELLKSLSSPLSPNKLSIKSGPIGSDENINHSCVNTFKDVINDTAHPYHSIITKIVRLCSYNKEKCNIARIKQVVARIRDHGLTKERALRFNEAKEVPDDFSHLFNINELDIFRHHMQRIQVQYRGQDGVGIGVVRTMIQNCVDEIKRCKFFSPVYPGSNRSVLNPNLTVQTIKDMGFNVHNEADVLKLYEFIGTFFAFCIRFEAPVPIYLARMVIANILYKPDDIKQHMSIFGYLIDCDPENVNSFLHMLRKPAEVEYAMRDYNDEYRLIDNSKPENPVDGSNFLDYLDRLSKHKFLHQIEKDAFDTNARFHAMMKGLYVKNALRDAKLTVLDFDRIFSGKAITLKTIREFVGNTNHVYCTSTNKREVRVYSWFMDILQETGKTIPMDDVPVGDSFKSESSSSHSSQRPKEPTPVRKRNHAFLVFFMHLMHFWTGYRKIDIENRHQVIFERNDGLPTAHTCFRQICLPRNAKSKADLYKRLVTAVFLVEKGVGLY